MYIYLIYIHICIYIYIYIYLIYIYIYIYLVFKSVRLGSWHRRVTRLVSRSQKLSEQLL